MHTLQTLYDCKSTLKAARDGSCGIGLDSSHLKHSFASIHTVFNTAARLEYI